MNNITHFEIPARDKERAQQFYSNIFDWDFQYMKEMDYIMFQTKDAEGNNSISGGIFAKQNDAHTVTNYVNVTNLDETIDKISKLGGNIIVPKTAVPGMGYFVHFIDTEGNLMGVWESDKEAK